MRKNLTLIGLVGVFGLSFFIAISNSVIASENVSEGGEFVTNLTVRVKNQSFDFDTYHEKTGTFASIGDELTFNVSLFMDYQNSRSFKFSDGLEIRALIEEKWVKLFNIDFKRKIDTRHFYLYRFHYRKRVKLDEALSKQMFSEKGIVYPLAVFNPLSNKKYEVAYRSNLKIKPMSPEVHGKRFKQEFKSSGKQVATWKDPVLDGIGKVLYVAPSYTIIRNLNNRRLEMLSHKPWNIPTSNFAPDLSENLRLVSEKYCRNLEKGYPRNHCYTYIGQCQSVENGERALSCYLRHRKVWFDSLSEKEYIANCRKDSKVDLQKKCIYQYVRLSAEKDPGRVERLIENYSDIFKSSNRNQKAWIYVEAASTMAKSNVSIAFTWCKKIKDQTIHDKCLAKVMEKVKL